MKICAWSSLSFLAAAHVTQYQPLYVLWVVSTLNHMGYRWIFEFDRTIAHAVCVWSMFTIPWSYSLSVFIYWYSWAWVLCVYYIFNLSAMSDNWHATTHVASSIGMMAHSWASAHVVSRVWFSLFVGLVHACLKMTDRYILC